MEKAGAVEPKEGYVIAWVRKNGPDGNLGPGDAGHVKIHRTEILYLVRQDIRELAREEVAKAMPVKPEVLLANQPGKAVTHTIYIKGFHQGRCVQVFEGETLEIRSVEK